jgi:hypothetical protein
MAQGYPYIDVGCFQIDLAYHAGVFRSLDEAFDPERNAQAAAQILADERARAPDWAVAVARYHSRTPTLGGPYLDRVRTALPMAKLRSAYARFASFSEPPVTGPEPLLGLAAPQSLPRVVYLSPARRLGREPQIIYLGQSGVSPVTETREHVGADHP